MQKGNENIQFGQGVKRVFFDSLENNGTKKLLVFDSPCEEACHAKNFADFAEAGTHRGLSTFHN